jgi:AcrR family transcriptional regulator
MNARRREIEDAASVLFGTRGYAATSMRDIARLVDLQGGSLYAHVSSKEDVLWAIVEDAAERFRAAVAPLAAGPGSAPRKLTAMARAHLGVVTAAPDRAMVFLYQWTALSARRRAQVAGVRDAYERYFRDVLAEGVAKGEIGPVDPRLAAIFVLSVLNGVAIWYRPDGPLTPEQIADQLVAMCLNGIAGDAKEQEQR